MQNPDCEVWNPKNNNRVGKIKYLLNMKEKSLVTDFVLLLEDDLVKDEDQVLLFVGQGGESAERDPNSGCSNNCTCPINATIGCGATDANRWC